MRVMRLQFHGITAAGGRSVNEDALDIMNGAGFQLLVLADGLGGHGGGDTAARACVHAVAAGFAANPSLAEDNLQALAAAAELAIIAARALNRTPKHAMRSTLALLAVKDNQARYAHIGDSRVYWFRSNNLVRRSRDHSLAERISEAGLDLDAGRNRLLRSLGTGNGTLECGPLIECLDGQDCFLLCSDGLWGLLPDAAITACLAGADHPRYWAEALERMLLAAASRLTEPPDNYTLITAMTTTDR